MLAAVRRLAAAHTRDLDPPPRGRRPESSTGAARTRGSPLQVPAAGASAAPTTVSDDSSPWFVTSCRKRLSGRDDLLRDRRLPPWAVSTTICGGFFMLPPVRSSRTVHLIAADSSCSLFGIRDTVACSCRCWAHSGRCWAHCGRCWARCDQRQAACPFAFSWRRVNRGQILAAECSTSCRPCEALAWSSRGTRPENRPSRNRARSPTSDTSFLSASRRLALDQGKYTESPCEC